MSSSDTTSETSDTSSESSDSTSSTSSISSDSESDSDNSESAPLPLSTIPWDDLPNEIYLYIFKKMDITSLRCCFSVSRKWREIATCLCELQDLWKAVAEDGMVNNGITQRQKSTLSWKDLYFNSFLWNDISSLEISQIGQVEKSDIINLHVYNDKLIVVHKSGVEYYDIETLQSVRLISMVCVDIQESDDMMMAVTDVGVHIYCKVTVFIKLDKDEEIDLENYLIPHTFPKTESIHAFAETCRWILAGNCVYVIDSKSCLWECSAIDNSLCIKALARFYGDYFTRVCTLNSIHVIEEDVYIALEWGDVLKCAKDSRMFRKVKKSRMPMKSVGTPQSSPQKFVTLQFMMSQGFVFHLHKFDAIIKFPFSFEFLDEDEAPLNMVHYHYNDSMMTAALQHGDVVIRGFEDGDIEITVIRDDYKHCFNVQDFDCYDEKNPAVVALEIFEVKGMHKLFFATKTKLHTVLLQYPNAGLDT